MPVPYKDKAKQAAYQNASNKRRRAEWITAHGPCKRCGSQKQLEVDHIDPKKKVDHKVWSWSKTRREAELAKCQVLCRKCHQKKTTAQSYAKMRHGTTRMRRKGGCACIACMKAVADERAYYRARAKRLGEAI